MTVTDPADTGASYIAMNLFQPPTAHKPVFEAALSAALAKVEALVPKFGLRNPRIGLAGNVGLPVLYCG